MPHSLRAKLGGLRYKGILEDKDYKQLCKALDNENVLEQIRAEIIKQFEGCYLEEDMTDERKAEHKAYKNVLQIIDKYR